MVIIINVLPIAVLCGFANNCFTNNCPLQYDRIATPQQLFYNQHRNVGMSYVTIIQYISLSERQKLCLEEHYSSTPMVAQCFYHMTS